MGRVDNTGKKGGNGGSEVKEGKVIYVEQKRKG